MVRKVNIRESECIGVNNELLRKYIMDKFLKKIESIEKPMKEKELRTITIYAAEAEALLGIDRKDSIEKVMKLCPTMDAEEVEAVVVDTIKGKIWSAFQNIMNYTEEFYVDGCKCIVTFISSINFREDIEIEISREYVTLYMDRERELRNGFVTLKLGAEKLNFHSRRLYEILMYESSKKKGYEEVNKVVISLEELKGRLGLHGGVYERYGDFKRRILKNGIDEISKLGYDIEVDEIKDGKRVEVLEFKVKSHVRVDPEVLNKKMGPYDDSSKKYEVLRNNIKDSVHELNKLVSKLEVNEVKKGEELLEFKVNK